MQTTRRKRPIVAMILVSASVLILQLLSLGVSVVHAQLGCTAASLMGPYGFSFTGRRVLGAGTGLLSFDGIASLSGTETLNLNGTITQGVALTGTYTVNDDCTGSMTVSNSFGVSNLNFVIDHTGSGMDFILTDSGTVITGSASGVQADPSGCTAASLTGSYAFSLIDLLNAAAATGVFSFDGTGNASSAYTVSHNGTITQGVAGTVTYTVNGDCTGSLAHTAEGTVGHFNFVIDGAGSRMEIIQTDSGTVTTGSARPQ